MRAMGARATRRQAARRRAWHRQRGVGALRGRGGVAEAAARPRPNARPKVSAAAAPVSKLISLSPPRYDATRKPEGHDEFEVLLAGTLPLLVRGPRPP